jgi:hypothetical protein
LDFRIRAMSKSLPRRASALPENTYVPSGFIVRLAWPPIRPKFQLMTLGPGVGGVATTGEASVVSSAVGGRATAVLGSATAVVDELAGAGVCADANALSEPASAHVAARVTMLKGFMGRSSSLRLVEQRPRTSAAATRDSPPSQRTCRAQVREIIGGARKSRVQSISDECSRPPLVHRLHDSRAAALRYPRVRATLGDDRA